MISIRKKFVAVAVAAAGVLGAAPAAHATSVTGGGASFPLQFITPAIAEFNRLNGTNLTYTSTGSGTGKRNFRSGTFKFAGTDSAVSAAETPAFDWTYIPYVAGPIGIGYRLDELQGVSLSLSKDTINGIFAGLIDNWNHPSIAADMKINPSWANSKKRSDVKGATALWQNESTTSAKITVSLLPAALKANKGKKIEWVDTTNKKVLKSLTIAAKGEVSMTSPVQLKHEYVVRVGGKDVANFKRVDVTLPNKPIVVVYRADTSGTTNNFCQYMRGEVNPAWAINDAFQNCVPGGITQFGSRFVGQPQSNNLSNYVADTNGSITYTESSFITDPTRAAKGMRAALVRNAAGKYVAPTSAAYNLHLDNASWDAKGFVTFTWNQSTNRDAYPIGAMTYGLCQTSNDAQNKVVAQFFEWVLNDYGPKNAEALGYTALGTTSKNKALPLAKKCGSV
jgi:ABC-type phosphate transport system substrate-binding protein